MINKRLKKFALIIACGLLSAAVQAQSTAFNTTGATGNPAAIVDMSANAHLGFLMPTVTFTSTVDVSAGNSIPSPAAGTIVYNSTLSVSNGLSGPGFYYWSGSSWLFLLNSGTNTSVTSVSGTAPINTVGTSTVTVSLQGTSGGIFYGTGGGSSITAAGAQGSMFYNSSANTPAWLGVGGSGTILSSNGTIPAWVTLASLGAVTGVNPTAPITANITAGNLSVGLSTPLDVQQGGTGLVTIPANGVLYGNGTSPVSIVAPVPNGVLISSATNVPSWLAAGTTGNVLAINGSGAPAWTSPSSLVTVNNGLTNTAGNIQLGGPLVQNTSVTQSNNTMTYDLGTGAAAGTGTFAVTNGGTGNTALYVNNSGKNRKVGGTPMPYGQVGIDNNSPDASAALDIQSTTGGLLIPRMTTLQQNAITSPATGLTIFNTTTNCYVFYGGVSIGWENIACSCSTAPAAPVVDPASPTTVCGGNSYTYSVGSVAGATGYTWAPPAGGAIISGQNSGTAAILMPNVATTTAATITVQSYNSCGAPTATQYTITINPSPAAPTLLNGFTSVCQGQSNIAYSVANVAGNSYIWTLPTGFTGSSLSDSIIANISSTAVSGTVTVGTLNNTTGCSSPTLASLPVTVNPTPSAPGTIIHNPSSVFHGSTGVVYSVPNTAGDTYTWTFPSGFTITSPPTASTVTVNISNTATSGNVSVIANVTGGFCYSSSSVPLAVSLGPPAVPSIPVQSPSGGICIGGTYTYSVAAVAGAANYIWNFPAGSMAVTTFTTAVPNKTVTYTAYPTCGSVTCQSQNTGVSGCTSGVSPALAIAVGNTCTQTFSYTNGPVPWNVPCGISNITVMLWGAGGGSANGAGGGSGGGGAFISGTLNVPQGAPLTMIVGGGGGQAGASSYGGGGGGTIGGTGFFTGGSGGGRAAIQYPVNTDLVTAGGGGGAGYPDGANPLCNGGGGGAPNGAAGSYALSGTVEFGGGGTPTAGGAAGCSSNGLCGDAGNTYTGGVAGGPDDSWIGGGGGGGYFGGGGGGSYEGSGGGGGSSYVTNAAFTLTTETGGVTSNNTSGTTGSGTGTSSAPGSVGANYPGGNVGVGAGPNAAGGNGYIWIQY